MTFFHLTGKVNQRIHGLRGSAAMFHLAGLGKRAVVVTHHTKQMAVWCESYKTFRPDARVFPLPPLDGSPHSLTPIHASTRRTRLRCMAAILENRWDLIVTHPRLFLELLPPPNRLLQPRLNLETGETYDIVELSRSLAEMGYSAVDMVGQPGDFARRGGILDIYSFADEQAYRLEFFDDELEEIRMLDPATQRGGDHLDQVAVLPMFEWLIGPEQAEVFGRRGGEMWNQSSARDHFLELVGQIRDRGRFTGYLHWTALFYAAGFHFYDFLDEDTVYFIDEWEAVQEGQEALLSQWALQRESSVNGKQVAAPPRVLFGHEDPARIVLPGKATVLEHRGLGIDRIDEELATQSVPAYHNNLERFLTHWKPQARRQAIVLVCRTQSMCARMAELMEARGATTHPLGFPLPPDLAPGFYVASGQLGTGFCWPERQLVVISEQDLWSRAAKPGRAPKGKKLFQTDFRDLKIGDYVVHQEHGVGKFLGLTEMEVGGTSHEMMAIVYRDNQKLYVHLNQLNLVQRYGSEHAGMGLDKLGGASWAKTKTRVKKAIRDMAEELLKLYAERTLTGKRPYAPDTEWQREMEDGFEYEPTEGQLTSIGDIKSDLESEKPMDRLLVGDVGYGKTEVAIRMAFKVVMEGMQVAVLCPTTVLAFQHFHTFRNRLAAFPVAVKWVSRFSKPAETRQILEDAFNGKVDILIGTHRLLSKDMKFKNLGAIIIDEEQRFGVAHKERLKHLRKRVDVLSMSATPIPRTLNMALSGIRDISVIETPPQNRLAINTTVAELRDGLIKNAVDFELEREGQVFFIHNRVETMDTVAAHLKKLVPYASIATAHGQMDSKGLERTMIDFMERKTDILVASTIIENGVDIPNANTMIVNRADRFGMSQLYQLRGRIGRSDRPAYAYLLVPPRGSMTPKARKRLATLEEFSDLGSGFRIAARDMELRGAGNLLGGEQAGYINAIGYELYVKLLEEAVAERQGKNPEDEVHCLVKLQFGASIPRSYMEDTNQRLHYYKRLAAAATVEEVAVLRETIRDCFGPLPAVTETLCREHELRIYLSAQKLLQVERDKDRIKLRFHQAAEVDADLVLGWIREKREVNVSPDGIVVPLASREPFAAMEEIRQTVEALVGDRIKT